MSYTPKAKDGRRVMTAPNPYSGLSTVELARAAGNLSDELREVRARTPQERRSLVDRCIYLLIACNHRLYGHGPGSETGRPKS
jgi:hypothetical protein